MSLKEGEAIKQIVKNCIKGDRAAQNELYKLYYSKMMGVCYRYSKDPDEAKDLLHDGFIKVFRSLHKFKFDGSLEGWIRRLMINVAIDSYRKSKNVFSLTDSNISEEMIRYDTVDTDMYSQFNTRDIMKAVQNLSPAYRTVFSLYVIEGYSHKEIAEKLNISVGTSKSNLAKAKLNLQHQLTSKGIVKNEF